MKISQSALVVFLLGGGLAAQTPLALEEALELALANNLQLKQQEQRETSARLEVDLRRGQLLPSLDVIATASYTDELAKFELPRSLTGGRLIQIELGGHDRSDLALALRQPLFSGGRLRTQVALAQNSMQSEALRRELLRQQTTFLVQQVFYQAQALKRQAQIQAASERRLRVQLEQMRSLYHAAQVMAFDTLQVHNQILQLNIEQDQNRRDQRLLDLQMARLLDLPVVRPIAEAPLARPAASPPPVAQLIQLALQRRPELASVRNGQRAAELTRRLAAAAYYPMLSAEASYHYAKPGLNQVANEWMRYGVVGVNLQWNLWRGRQDHRRVQQAEAERTRLSLQERELTASISHEVERGYENLQLAARQIALAEHLVAQQQERYRIVTVHQREGVATTNDVIVAENDLRAAELQLQRTLVQYHLAHSELQLATGGSVPLQ
ncbi:MAG: TolC family protein [candidate division KSB1 bacterium]|nr:TolC family protein [candidate division KSB1 bacterium]MDZ7273093.1 TolC family protein [candidate division KSB1 bacterium]MDZ7285196.1 TolC family protein [candidate division KSB1 bacterium]MDZ7298228.1 TolC family protein [candidate division KSB1 bacterium]MDZ7306730.1 TolC family protein [candidate division KSB1 bacterium]